MDRLIALNQLLGQVLGGEAGLRVQLFHVFVIFVLLFLILVEEELVGQVVLRQKPSLQGKLLRGLWIAIFRLGVITLMLFFEAHKVAIPIMRVPSFLDLFWHLISCFCIKRGKHLPVGY